ncbi:nuclear transport factor 2 family protein [Agromyces sp. ISL-38]|uniref:nuclear transport factor 2 family protein n=1 Tax=Agromyces sp. ISL-38 TaxID=2819107 RepID=UPI001BE5E606|nr:nuclear transport factor 2 family protein [Agromyces sp. ISL-38]MBT2500055.1 nuclear transport factor 2 family protein [Agromyces sp. ISL-38]MBT2518776.1 nuclear transport factor 2 family protein [Streptomyces sp. ISL-90]
MSEMNPEAAARAYIDAVGGRDLAPLETILDEQMVATFSGTRLGKQEWIEAIRRLLPVLIRNDIREIFAAGERACVVYDFVTDTPAGAVVCVELVTVRGGRITEIELVLDRVTFAPVQEALKALAAQG